jgi:hypothetical protein
VVTFSVIGGNGGLTGYYGGLAIKSNLLEFEKYFKENVQTTNIKKSKYFS